MIFPEAITELAMYRQFADAVKVPVLANITEFGKTPLFTRRRAALGRRRHRALSAVGLPRDEQGRAERLRDDPRATARRRTCVDTMQTRAELYDYLDYHAYEQKLDRLFAKRKTSMSQTNATADAAAPKPKKSVALSGVPPATPRCARSAAPATTCTTAATTSSTSPTRREFEEIAYLLVHGKLPNARRARRLQDASCKALRGLPAAVQGGARSASRRRPIRWT